MRSKDRNRLEDGDAVRTWQRDAGDIELESNVNSNEAGVPQHLIMWQSMLAAMHFLFLEAVPLVWSRELS